MTHYLLPCSCGAELSVDTSQAGESMDCPDCGGQLEVPSLRGLKHLAVAGQQPSADSSLRAAAYSVAKPKKWAPGQLAVLVAGAGLVAACGAAMLVIHWIRADVANYVWTAEDDIQLSTEFIDQLNAQQSLELWNVYRERGIGVHASPDYVNEQRRMKVLHALMITCGVLLAGGVALMIAGFWSRARSLRVSSA